jgi:excisionase family DNA binding protein
MAEKLKPRTMTVPDAGWEYLGLSRNAAYDAAARGEIPTIRVGKLLRVPIARMEKMLEEAGKKTEAA